MSLFWKSSSFYRNSFKISLITVLKKKPLILKKKSRCSLRKNHCDISSGSPIDTCLGIALGIPFKIHTGIYPENSWGNYPKNPGEIPPDISAGVHIEVPAGFYPDNPQCITPEIYSALSLTPMISFTGL